MDRVCSYAMHPSPSHRYGFDDYLKRYTCLCADKNADDMVFDTMDATDLNKHVQELMPGLSIKVFRTYNASITLDGLLHKESDADTTEEKKVDYDRANKEVGADCLVCVFAFVACAGICLVGHDAWAMGLHARLPALCPCETPIATCLHISLTL